MTYIDHIEDELKTLVLDPDTALEPKRRQFLEHRRYLEVCPPPEEAPAVLLITPTEKTWYSLPEVFTIGRYRKSDCRLNKEWVSNKHCMIQHTSDGWVVEDCNSTNGTFVNGKQIKRRILCLGDVIELGTSRLLFYQPIAE